MNVYNELLERVANGSRFTIDFIKKTIKVGGKHLITENAELNVDFEGNVYDKIEELYANYKSSMPSERSELKRKKYFKAKAIDELTINEYVNAEPRELAQAKLEGFILCNILNGKLKWTKPGWFWQGTDDDLILLKEWFVCQ